ncbi:MAG: hypothetical protein KJ072_25025 [Verrucomicrobia bacterium]|nr:hypothetical protein [Verrucomicrobiota bacterium]
MHVQLLKEWRLLRPGLVAAIGLALLPLVLPVAPEISDERGYFLAFGLFLGGVLLAIEAFGAEFHQRTSTLWMALPQPRAGLWRSKLAMTGLAVATALLVHWMALVAGAPWRGGLPNLIEFVRPMVAILGGAALGLFWSVQLRQTWAAFWMSLIVPGALAVLIQLLLALFSPMPENDQATRASHFGGLFAAGFCVIGVVAFALARRRFEQLEDLGPLGEDLQLKLPGFLRARAAVGVERERHPLTATGSLWWKEIRLQQVNLALAGGFALVMLLAQILKRVALSIPERFNPRDLEALDMLWALWSLLPLTIGLASFAEERRLGVDSWQETLPVSRARRWWIKIGAAYGLAFGIGVAVPVIGEQLFRSDPFTGMVLFHGLAWLVMTTAGIYVSSLARNLVHAISILVPFAVGVGLAWAGGLWLTQAWSQQQMSAYAAIPLELHFNEVVGLLVLATALYLAWRNSAPGRREGLALRFNLSCLTTAWIVGVLLVSGMRVRAWEWFRPEPSPLTPIAASPGVQPDMAAGWWNVVVLTPDGRLWRYGFNFPPTGGREEALHARPASLRQLGADHRWSSFGSSEPAIDAVRSDGTLWHWGGFLEPDPDKPPGHLRRRAGSALDWERPTQIGSDSDWQSVAAAYGHTAALKRDGTLWGWGNNRNGQLGQPDVDYAFDPIRIGSATNWTLIAAGRENVLAANEDGEVWEWGWVVQPPRPSEDGSRRRPSPTRIASGMTWRKLLYTDRACLGLTAQGEVWVLREWAYQRGPDTPLRWLRQATRDVTFGWGDVWSVNEQGRLLRWLRPGWDPLAIQELAVRQVGGRDDWLAVEGGQTYFGLTADGALWSWGFEFGEYREPWLPPSQRPRQVALLRADPSSTANGRE